MRPADAHAAAGDRLGGWREAVIHATGWRRPALAFVAGGLSNLAMAPFFLAPVLFLTLPVLVWLIDGATDAERGTRAALFAAARAGWWFGFGYFLFGLFWIGEAFLVEADTFGWMLPFAVTLMPAGLALFWAAAAAAARVFWRPGAVRLVLLALSLGIVEWLRGHILTGFPWNVLGYALTWPLSMMQSAGLVGIYTLTLLAVLVFAAPLVMAADAIAGVPRRRAGFRALLITAVPLALLAAYGTVRLATAPSDRVEGVVLRIVQPSVPQREKWQADKQAVIFKDHLDLSLTDPAGKRDDLVGVTHVVWPEAAMPFLPLERPEALAAIGDMLPDGVHLLTGALRREPAEDGVGDVRGHPFRAFNSLMVFDGDGALAGLYDKTHLVPFGEYLPWQATLEAIGLEQLTRMRGGFTEGSTPRPALDVPGLPVVGGLICYEAIFPGVGRKSTERPGLLLNVTNDGWFGSTTGPYQHFHQARVRAVEEGLPLIRAANNGISAVIDANGRIVARLGLNERGTLDSSLPRAHNRPLYAMWGDIIFLVAGLLLAATLAPSLKAVRR
ncbi:apolipoprotein N-acyltransferase [Hyphomicrobium nitrativorans NL23]|uniref:Apolipoprotein N-acyltransferase n=1 Tax=Hyphomicrobium nitrativorans NL23 TaxID=1029756 RepID=V5SCN6_9HYPH|nr:apolipoprotein N-acyltransferase [Hyphomicrobium nitrativorans]AHB48283.1 apolipoprotein N-acyltransferase [Hyphomicrobium nitrativorans NL23]